MFCWIELASFSLTRAQSVALQSDCEIRHKKSTMKGNLHRAKVLESFCESFGLFREFVKVLRKFWKVFRVF